jgi:hypothetical protein
MQQETWLLACVIALENMTFVCGNSNTNSAHYKKTGPLQYRFEISDAKEPENKPTHRNVYKLTSTLASR